MEDHICPGNDPDTAEIWFCNIHGTNWPAEDNVYPDCESEWGPVFPGDSNYPDDDKKD